MRASWACVAALVIASSLSAAEPTGKLVRETWDAAFLNGQKAGHFHTTVIEFQRDNQTILRGWLATWVPRAISAARTLQPIWSQPDAKPPRFEDGLDACKSRFTGILSELSLEAPKELAQ